MAQSAKLDIRQLAEVPIAVFRKGYALSQQISELFESYGVHPKIMAQTSNFVTIQSLIKCGAAGGFLMREVCEEEPDLVYFDVPELETFPIYLAWKKKAYLSIAAKDFISSCLQIQDIKNIYG